MAVETYYTLTIGGAVNIPFGDQTVQDRWRLVFGNKPSNDERPERRCLAGRGDGGRVIAESRRKRTL